MLTVDSLRLTGDRILVDPDPRLPISEGGLHIPDTVLAENPNYFSMTGRVLKLGDGLPTAIWECVTCGQWSEVDRGSCSHCKLQLAGTNLRLLDAGTGARKAFDVAVGDRVLFNRFAGKQVELEISVDVFSGRPPTAEDRARHEGPGEIVLSVNSYSHTEKQSQRFLIMREHEVLGIVEGDHRIVPGYEAPKWGKTTDGNRPGIQVL